MKILLEISSAKWKIDIPVDLDDPEIEDTEHWNMLCGVCVKIKKTESEPQAPADGVKFCQCAMNSTSPEMACESCGRPRR